MKEIERLTSRLLDIEMPAAPPLEVDNNWAILLLVTVIAVTYFILFFYKHSTIRHKRALLKIKHQLTSSAVTPKTACYKLAGLLKSIHKTKHLTDKTLGLSTSHQKQWSGFLDRLTLYRYKSSCVDKHDVLILIDESIHWLKVNK